MHTQLIEYKDGDAVLEAFVAKDDSFAGKRPAVLVNHAWGGQGDYERERAVMLAEMGYVGIALDNYGKGKRGTNPEENTRLMTPFIQDRALLRQRLAAGLAFAKGHKDVDVDRIAAIGYCFGGLCALDMARAGDVQLKGVVSFHGLFAKPELGPQAPISAKVLILHGYDDPMAKPDQMIAVADEMTAAKADWQIVAYGHTVHGFSNPQANMPDNGILYNSAAAARSWKAMQNFLAEVFI
jgi:dienelactone hydrolase